VARVVRAEVQVAAQALRAVAVRVALAAQLALAAQQARALVAPAEWSGRLERMVVAAAASRAAVAEQ